MIHSIQQYLNLPFDEYLKLPGRSTSFLKNEKNGVSPVFIKTDKVRVGSLVDAILTSPKEVDMRSELYPIARDIAAEIRLKFGDMFKQMIPQVSYTGIMAHSGISMPVKGRLDFLLPELAVIDLKVTYATNVPELIKFMKYAEQMHLYCGFAGVKKAYLIVYCVPKKICKVHAIDCSGRSLWWEGKTFEFGSAD